MFRRKLSIILATAVAVAAGFGTFKAAQIKAQVPEAPAVVVKAPVGRTQAIPDGALEVKMLPREAVPADAVASLDAVKGRAAAVELYPGQVLQKPMLAEQPVRRGLQPGEVAVEVPVNVGSGATFLELGDRVNVVVVLKGAGASMDAAGTTTPSGYGTVLRGARVIALKDSAGADVGRKNAQGGIAAVTGAVQGGGIPAAAVLAVSEAEADLLAWYLDHSTVRLVVAPW